MSGAAISAREAQGFTLIELLASLLAGSLLLLWLGWAVGAIGDQWTRSSEPDPVRELAHQRQTIVELIEGALYPLDSDALPPPTVTRLSFAIVPPRAVSGPTAARLTLAVERDGTDTEKLVALLHDLKSGAVLAPTSILARGWRHIVFRSEDPVPESGRALVEIDFIAKNGERYAVIARPKIDSEPGCEFDPISHECRR